MEHVVETITAYMLRKGFITKGQTEWCHYMVFHRLMNIISFSLLVPIGAIVVGWWGSLLYTTVFRFLRSRTGGYHAKTPHQCIITSISLQVVFLIGAVLLPKIEPLLMVFIVLLGGGILLLAPANNCELHLTAEEIQALYPRIWIRVGVCIIAYLVLSKFDITIASCIFVAMVAVLILLVSARLGYGIH